MMNHRLVVPPRVVLLQLSCLHHPPPDRPHLPPQLVQRLRCAMVVEHRAEGERPAPAESNREDVERRADHEALEVPWPLPPRPAQEPQAACQPLALSAPALGLL